MFRRFYYFLTHTPVRAPHEMRRALLKYGMFYEEFQLYDCAGRDDAYVSSFITECNRYRIYRRYNRRRDLPLYHNKFRVYQIYRDFYHREVISVTNSKDKPDFLSFIQRHPRFIVKPTDKSCGYGVKLIDTTGKSPDEIFRDLLHSGKSVCEEIILPHPILARLNPTSLNTVRVVTVLEDENVRLFHPFLRVGRYGNIVDNGGAGGILIPVDPMTGQLSPIGRDENGQYYTEHPDSHVRFRGISLPDWDKAVNLAKTLAHVRPQNRLIGWDIAATPDGWVMVEANIRGQFLGQQMCDRIGKLHEL